MTEPPLESRLEQLQRQNRWLTGGLVAMSGVALGMLFSGARHAPPPAVATHPPPSVTVSAVSLGTPAATQTSATPPQLQITLNPPTRGLILRIDGATVGRSDLQGFKVQIAPGRHHVVVLGPGFASIQRDVAVSASSGVLRIDLPALRLAGMTVETRPPQSEVHIEGPSDRTWHGTSPMLLHNLRPGRYRVEVSHGGYESLVMVFHLPPGSRLDKLAVLPELVPAVAWTAPRPRRWPHHRPLAVATPAAIVPAPQATEESDDDPTPTVSEPVPGVPPTAPMATPEDN